MTAAYIISDGSDHVYNYRDYLHKSGNTLVFCEKYAKI